jgi:hypothetical protein
MIACLAGFFAVRWFITFAIATHVLMLMGGLGLSTHEAVLTAMLIGPARSPGECWSGCWQGGSVPSPGHGWAHCCFRPGR